MLENKNMIKKRPKILGFSQAAKFVGVSPQRFGLLVKKYNIIYQQIPGTKVFFEDDLIDFIRSQERQKNMERYEKRKQSKNK